jgi:hypothetical protein
MGTPSGGHLFGATQRNWAGEWLLPRAIACRPFFGLYGLVAPLGASLAIAIRGVMPQEREGARSDATIASDPIAPSHFPTIEVRLNRAGSGR